ncbi:hypothetical protein K493DRAFT_361311 [Basidiobolus meristosporus CBS 931.73]|uniref:Uncharacterized protein n=1 Tax=Basidiobolus meristosporus CBS 931.73 TaxID=1314790 RepID=A0A1Y1XAQ2_9FUNG|nr:hypothetical protein K493DRAFT_361311 [Basidiobolus meristosporus CBS 931.73]|eukprot:ORX82793.1 hypothetical protein K493DRAFT_361311 [Basidiobolus meristosporus CBS 931.73]
MMGLNVRKVRKQERKLAKFLEKLNKEDYISPVSLAKQNCTLAKLAPNNDSPMIFSTVEPTFPLSEFIDEIERAHPALDPSVEEFLHKINEDALDSEPRDKVPAHDTRLTSFESTHDTSGTSGNPSGYHLSENGEASYSHEKPKLGQFGEKSSHSKSTRPHMPERKESSPDPSLIRSAEVASAPQTHSNSNSLNYLVSSTTSGNAEITQPLQGLPISEVISETPPILTEEQSKSRSLNEGFTTKEQENLGALSGNTPTPKKVGSVEGKLPKDPQSVSPDVASDISPDLISFPLMNNLQADGKPSTSEDKLAEAPAPSVVEKPMEQYIIDDPIGTSGEGFKVPTLKDSILPNENI